MMTLILVAVTVAVSLLAWQSPVLMQRLLFYPPAIARGQVERFATYGFIHSSGFHLAFNMIGLYSFGQVMERFFNAKLPVIGFLLFYVAALVVSTIPDYIKHKNDPNYAVLGASGAVSAIVFSSILFDPWSLIVFFIIPMPAIVFAILFIGYSVYADRYRHDNIGHSVHLVGAIFGMLATMAVEPRIVPHFFDALMHPRFGF